MKQIYVASCIEHGERFVTYFQTIETNKAKLREMGQDLAMGWGAECISVKKWKPRKFVVIRDNRRPKENTITARQWNTFKKKYSNWATCIKVIREFEEEPPKDVWDCEKTLEENCKGLEERSSKPIPC